MQNTNTTYDLSFSEKMYKSKKTQFTQIYYCHSFILQNYVYIYN